MSPLETIPPGYFGTSKPSVRLDYRLALADTLNELSAKLNTVLPVMRFSVVIGAEAYDIGYIVRAALR